MQNLLFCPHTPCMNYVSNKFLLVSSSVSSKQLLCFCAWSRPKKRTKTNSKVKNFVEFHNHSLLLTIVKVSRWLIFVHSLGRVNSPVVQNAITRQSKASVICPTELSRKSISQFETGLLALFLFKFNTI